MESPSSIIAKSLSLLEEQEAKYQSIINNNVQLKDHILSLKLGLPFLEIFHWVSTNEGLLLRIDSVLDDVRLDLYSLSNRPINGNLSEPLIQHLDYVYTDLREKMKNVIVKPGTEEYDKFSGHSPDITEEYDEFLGHASDTTEDYDGFLEHASDTREGLLRGHLLREHLKQINDFLLQTSRGLSNSKANLIAPLMQEIEGIKELLIFLQPMCTYLMGPLQILAEREDSQDLSMEYFLESKKLLNLTALLNKVACVLYNCSIEKMNEEMTLTIKHKLSDLQEKTNVKQIYIEILRGPRSKIPITESLVKPLYNLIELLDCNASFVKYLNDPSKKLHEQLQFLLTLIAGLPHLLNLASFSYLLTSIEAIIQKSVPVLYSCHVTNMKEDMAREVNGALSEVLDQIKHIEQNAGHIQLYNKYPKTDGLGFLKQFLGHLEELLRFQPKLIGTFKDQVHTLHVEFLSTLEEINEQQNKHEKLRDIWSRIICLGYQAEYFIDLYLVENSTYSHIMFSLSEIIKQIKLLKAKVKKINIERVKCHYQADNVAKVPSCFPSQAIDTKSDDEVGFEDQAREIMEFLVADEEKLDFISIIGMAGAGKTTLAKKIYKDPSIIDHFHVRAWCTVSQTYQKRELLLAILHCIIKVTNDIKKLTDEELSAKLWQSLKGYRYLIVIDDMWDIMAWNDIRRSFPNDNKCSRILITTRIKGVASNIKASSKVLHLRQLTDVEGWELFQKTLKQKDNFSEDFLKVGIQIVQSCKGLPLAIVVIAGLLSKVDESVLEWEKIAGGLSSHVLINSESPCMPIIELSYNHLPDHLKSCFLYFAAFAADEVIPVQNLKRLWIAEGFVCEKEAKILEDVAEEYFKDLINRSLVIPTEERSLEGIKACRIHDVLHEFCLEKAKQESFLQLVKADHFYKFSKLYDQRRLIIHSWTSDLTTAAPVGLGVRSLSHTSPECRTFLWQDFSFIFENFKLLTVLNLLYMVLDSTAFTGTTLLIHLKYLAIQVATTIIPQTISNLWNLEYFIFKNSSRHEYIVEVPDSLWDMKKLRAVCIHPLADFSIHVRRFKNSSSSLDNLKKLSSVTLESLSCQEGKVMFLSKTSELRKLGCCFWSCTWDKSAKAWQFPELESLHQLVSLNVYLRCRDYWRKGGRCELKFPPNLKKLTLSRCRVPWEDISSIGSSLCNLKALKIDGEGMYRDDERGSSWHCSKKWDMDGRDFPELRYLKLSGLEHLHEWIASEDSFPKLEQLVLKRCRGLREIPPCFGGIYTLRMITVWSCRASVDNSARTIQREQKDMGNEEIKVNIDPSSKLEVSLRIRLLDEMMSGNRISATAF